MDPARPRHLGRALRARGGRGRNHSQADASKKRDTRCLRWPGRLARLPRSARRASRWAVGPRMVGAPSSGPGRLRRGSDRRSEFRKRSRSMNAETVSVRYMVSDVAKALAFYTSHLGFTVESNFAPAF